MEKEPTEGGLWLTEMMRLLGGLLLAASASANTVGHASQVAGKMQELNLQQVRARETERARGATL